MFDADCLDDNNSTNHRSSLPVHPQTKQRSFYSVVVILVVVTLAFYFWSY